MEVCAAPASFSRVDVLGAWAFGDDSPGGCVMHQLDDDYGRSRTSSASTSCAAMPEHHDVQANSSSDGVVASSAEGMEASTDALGAAAPGPSVLPRMAEYTANARQGLATVAEAGIATAAERIKERWALATEVVSTLSQADRSPQGVEAADCSGTDDDRQSRWDRVQEATQQAAERVELVRTGVAQARNNLLQAAERAVKQHALAPAQDAMVRQASADGAEGEESSHSQDDPAPHWERVQEAKLQAAERVEMVIQGVEQVRTQARLGLVQAAERVKSGLAPPPAQGLEATSSRSTTDAESSEHSATDEEQAAPRWERVQEARMQATETVENVRQGVEQVRLQARTGLFQAAERMKLGIAQAAERAQISSAATPTATTKVEVPEAVAFQSRPFWEVAVQDIEDPGKSPAHQGQWLDTQALSEGLGMFCRRSVLGSALRGEVPALNDIRTS